MTCDNSVKVCEPTEYTFCPEKVSYLPLVILQQICGFPSLFKADISDTN